MHKIILTTLLVMSLGVSACVMRPMQDGRGGGDGRHEDRRDGPDTRHEQHRDGDNRHDERRDGNWGQHDERGQRNDWRN